MLGFCLALALIVALMLGHLALVQLFVDPSSVLWRTHARLRLWALVRRETADLDRGYADLVAEHRRTP